MLKHKECRDRRKGFYVTNFPTVFSFKRNFLLGFASSDTSFHLKVVGAGPSNWRMEKGNYEMVFLWDSVVLLLILKRLSIKEFSFFFFSFYEATFIN